MGNSPSIPDRLSIARFLESTRAEGPGLRAALWVQGCSIRCPGCCNPEMFAGEMGLSVEASTVNEWLNRAKEKFDIEGITLLGGEPTEQAAGLLPVIRHAQSMGLNVMIFSGRTLEELRSQGSSAIDELLGRTDILVDGPFDSQRKDNKRRWVGSTNQRIHDLSGRMKPDDSQWAQSNTVEIRLDASGNQLALTINGFPFEGGVSLWKRIPLASFQPEKKE